MPHTMLGKPWSFCAREGKVCNASFMFVFVKKQQKPVEDYDFYQLTNIPDFIDHLKT